MFYGKSEWGRRKQLHFLQDPGGLPSRAEAKQVHMKWTKQMRSAQTMPFIHPKTTTSSMHCEINACTNAEMEVRIPGHPLSNIATSTRVLPATTKSEKKRYLCGRESPKPQTKVSIQPLAVNDSPENSNQAVGYPPLHTHKVKGCDEPTYFHNSFL